MVLFSHERFDTRISSRNGVSRALVLRGAAAEHERSPNLLKALVRSRGGLNVRAFLAGGRLALAGESS
jgi:hypothetical protein